MTDNVTGSAALQGKEISKLAREYAEDYMRTNAPEVSLSDNLTNEIEKQVKPVLQWLLRDHCIVNKEKVKNHYTEAKVRHDIYTNATCINTLESQMLDHSKGRIYTLTELFGADLFKERSEK